MTLLVKRTWCFPVADATTGMDSPASAMIATSALRIMLPLSGMLPLSRIAGFVPTIRPVSGERTIGRFGCQRRRLPCWRWTSRTRSENGARIRPLLPSRFPGGSWTSCSSSGGGRRTTTSRTRGASAYSGRPRYSESRPPPVPKPQPSSTARRLWSPSLRSAPAIQSRMKRTIARPPALRMRCCSPPMGVGSRATGERRTCCGHAKVATPWRSTTTSDSWRSSTSAGPVRRRSRRSERLAATWSVIWTSQANRGSASVPLVFVVAAEPAHGLIAFVAALGHAVEDRIVAHQKLRPAGVGGVAVVDGVALARERADAVSLGEITVDVRTARGGVLRRGERQVLTDGRLFAQQSQGPYLVGLEERHGWLMRHLLAGRHTEVEVEVAFVAGRPVEAPAHPLAVGEQLLKRGSRDADHRHVSSLEVGEYAVEAVGSQRAGGTSGVVVEAEHEVVDEQLGAAVEQLRQAPWSVSGLERVLLLDWDPRKLSALPGELIAHPGELLLAPQQLSARGGPFFTRCDPS